MAKKLKSSTVTFTIKGQTNPITAPERTFEIAERYFGAVRVSDVQREIPIELLRPLVMPPKLPIIKAEKPPEVTIKKTIQHEPVKAEVVKEPVNVTVTAEPVKEPVKVEAVKVPVKKPVRKTVKK